MFKIDLNAFVMQLIQSCLLINITYDFFNTVKSFTYQVCLNSFEYLYRSTGIDKRSCTYLNCRSAGKKEFYGIFSVGNSPNL